MATVNQAGKYTGRAIGWGLIESEEKGTVGLEIQFRISHPDPSVNGAVMWSRVWFPESNEKQFQRNVSLVKYMGWDGKDFADLDNGKADLRNKDVELDVQPEEYKGKTELRVKWVNDPTRAPERKQMDAGRKQSVLARLQSRLGGGSSAPRAQDDTDIPF